MTRRRAELPRPTDRPVLHGPQLDGLTLERAVPPKGHWGGRARWFIRTVLAVSGLGIALVIGVEYWDLERMARSPLPGNLPGSEATDAEASGARVENSARPQSGSALGESVGQPLAVAPGTPRTKQSVGRGALSPRGQSTAVEDSARPRSGSALGESVGRPLAVPPDTPRTEQSVGRGTLSPRGPSTPVEPRTVPHSAPLVTPTETRGPDRRLRNAEAPSRQTATSSDPVRTMAAYLAARLGREDAEKMARANAGWYEADSAEFAYWQRVAEIIKGTASGSRTAR